MARERASTIAIWEGVIALLLLEIVLAPPRPANIWFAAAELFLIIFGIVRIIRSELVKGERLKAIGRGECLGCGYDMAGLNDLAVCLECGDDRQQSR